MLREPLSSTLASLPRSFHAEREELLELLRTRGILHRSETQPVLSRDGTSARWMLDTLSVTLAPRGAELAGRCILELLKRFDARQVATYGLTAVPILQSCVLQSGGRLRGLLVRKERKAHGSLKLIEGAFDPSEPVVLIDDSISSGTSMNEACARLEEAGLRVEGAVALVRFGWYGGYAAAQERGYHVEAVYDIWEDFIYHMEGEEKPLRNPSKWFPAFEWSAESAPEGLHPSHLARVCIDEYLKTGRLLRPPARLDAEYDSAGGVWVSLRSRRDVHLRYARDGFWHFPEEGHGATVAEDIVMASLRTAVQLPAGDEGLKALADSAVAVTFFPALERCDVGGLDNERYGIVVRSRERPSWMGGALPLMPGIGGEWKQLEHARRKNARLVSFEPYEIFRHEVVKAVEPGERWQPTGVPSGARKAWHEDERVCGPVAARARDLVLAALLGRAETTAPLPADSVPEGLDSVYLTVYVAGRLRGCMGAVVRDLDRDLQTLARAALADTRFADDGEDASADDASVNDGASVNDEATTTNEAARANDAEVAVSVSFLFAPLVLGHFTPEEVAARVRHGRQTLMAYRGERVGLLLPFVASMYNLGGVEFARAVLQKAGIEGPPYDWCRFDSATWLADSTAPRPTLGGFPQSASTDSSLAELLGRLASLHARYVTRHARDDGTLYLRYEPFQDRLYEGLDTPRLAHAAWVAARAGRLLDAPALSSVADRIIDRLVGSLDDGEHGCWVVSPDDANAPTVAEVSFLLLALLELDTHDERRSNIARLASTLRASIDAHGRVATHRPPEPSHDVYQDYFPGQVLLALAAASAAGLTEVDEEKLRRAFRFYRHRFRYRRNFGQVSWLMQAFARWWGVNGDGEFAEFVLEVGDWIMTYQHEKTGGFLGDHQPDAPGYTTALYLEGIAAGLRVARGAGDQARRRRYLDSIERGFRFLERLVIQPRDACVLPNPAWAVGGLRQSLHRSEVRIDFVQHALSAITELHPLDELTSQ